MKKFVFITGLFATLIGCGSPETTKTEVKQEERFYYIYDQGDYAVIADKETGCQYIKFETAYNSGLAGGLTPLIKPDGTPFCSKN